MSQDRSSRLHPDSASSTAQPRTRSPNLHIGHLPRFHPANFPDPNATSTTSSAVTSPASGMSSPAAPSSPRLQPHHHLPSHSHHHAHAERREYADAPQRQLYAQQRDMIDHHRSLMITQQSPRSKGTITNPSSPLLEPCRSPTGPVTPLELEEHSDYLGSGSSKQLNEDFKNQVAEHYVRKERPSSPVEIRRPGSPRLMAIKKGDHTRHRSHLSR